jgi:predicted N-acyltransferase
MCITAFCIFVNRNPAIPHGIGCKIKKVIGNSTNLDIRVAHCITEVNEREWNELSAGRPFQSHRWYAFGERVMDDCKPVFLLAVQDHALVGRAALWNVHNEPLPKMPALARRSLMAVIKKWPLLICRSPLAFTSGLAVSNQIDPLPVMSMLAGSAKQIAAEQNDSFLLFDYLQTADAKFFPGGFASMSNASPGNIMENHWASLDEYLHSGDKKDRQHYKRTLREAEKLNICIERHTRVENIDEALHLIRNVERNKGALPNPWARRTLENMEMVNGTYLTAKIGDRLVGCGLLLEDNASQTTSLLGLADDVPYAYFMLAYESLSIAFEHKVRFLRWGSGAYDVKKRFGFSLEDNGTTTFSAVNPFVQKAIQRFM